MKTSVKSMFLLALLFLIPNYVKAASSCSYSEQAELNEIVSHVNANYEIVDVYKGKVYDLDHPDENGYIKEVDYYIKAFNINILNITEDIYVKVSNNYNDEVKTFRYSDAQDGVITFQTTEVENLITYTIEVYSNKYACAGEMFRKLTLTTPLYNNYSERPQCEGNKDFYYCQEFITSENISYTEFVEKINKYTEQKQVEVEKQQEENKNFFEKLKKFYKDNAIVINSVGVAIVVMGVATTVVLIKKKRSRVL